MNNAYASELNSLTSAYLPTVTVNMLLHYLDEDGIVSKPKNCRRIFRAFESSIIDISERPSGLSSSQILHICKLSEALNVLETDPHIFVCALSGEDDPLPESLTDYSDRLIIVKPKDSFMYFMFSIQRFFSNIALMKAEFERLSCMPKNLEELLSKAADALRSFIICYDADGQVLACSANREAPTEALREAARTRCLPHGFSTDDATYTTHEIDVDGNRFATVLVASDAAIDSGLRDLFSIACKYIDTACKSIYKSQVKATNPHHFMLSRLVKGETVSHEILNNWSEELGIPSPSQFKLVLFDTSSLHGSSAPLFSDITNSAKLINHGDCLFFMHQNRLCVLCYAQEGDNQLSNKKTMEDVTKLISRPFRIAASASQIFDNITDIDLAYRQTIIGMNLRDILEKETFNRSDKHSYPKEDTPPLIPFENCVIYYLAGSSEKDERFLQFIFSHTLMQKLNEEDRLNNTNKLEIFWEYLSCERNATTVAQKLHLHRNTIVYHINKIEQRFDIDLSSRDVREKMLLDFKVFFLMQHRSSLARIFGQHGSYE